MNKILKRIGIFVVVAALLIGLLILILNEGILGDEVTCTKRLYPILDYNYGYTNYVGKKVRGRTVRQLVNKINSHNNNGLEIAQYDTIELIYNNENDCEKIIASILSNSYYTVSIVKYNEFGAVSKIIIEDYEVKSDNISAELMQIYNDNYIYYTRYEVEGTTAKYLVDKVNSHNNNGLEVAQYGSIELIYNNEKDYEIITDSIVSNSFYTVSIVKYNKLGAVSKIMIEDYGVKPNNISTNNDEIKDKLLKIIVISVAAAALGIVLIVIVLKTRSSKNEDEHKELKEMTKEIKK